MAESKVNKMQEKKAFEFVKLHDLPPKPRKRGIVEIRGPYYSSVTYGYLCDLLDDWCEYFDGYKFAGGSMRLLSQTKVRSIIKVCHDHGVYVSTGGFVERVIAEGGGAVDRYLLECKSLGFDVVEVSSGLAPIKLADKVAIVKKVIELGMEPKPEVSMMIGAGAGTHIVGYEERMRYRSLANLEEEVRAHIDVGAETLMLESEGITEDLPPNKWRTKVIKKLVSDFGYQRWMFEASDPPVFKWYLKNFGRDVNLFIDHSQVVEFNAWRLGLWGDPKIWKDKDLSYPAV
jgi:phosphosulfolactate synthase (CoM biosynthesis protein A)